MLQSLSSDNDAADILTRQSSLSDYGTLLTQSQQLVELICHHCSKPYISQVDFHY